MTTTTLAVYYVQNRVGYATVDNEMLDQVTRAMNEVWHGERESAVFFWGDYEFVVKMLSRPICYIKGGEWPFGSHIDLCGSWNEGDDCYAVQNGFLPTMRQRAINLLRFGRNMRWADHEHQLDYVMYADGRLFGAQYYARRDGSTECRQIDLDLDACVLGCWDDKRVFVNNGQYVIDFGDTNV